MKQIYFMLHVLLLLSHVHNLNGAFSPDRSNYDAYGVKIAMNEFLLVQANNNEAPPSFFVQLAPYNSTSDSSQCSNNYFDTDNDFVYSVAVASRPTQNQIAFLFAGKSLNSSIGIFIGVAKYNLTSNATASSSSCDNSFSYTIKYFVDYPHQEYYIIGVQPNGLFAYGFANDFIFIFDTQNATSLDIWNSSLTWPNNTFTPHAVDISDNFGVVAGFIKNDPSQRIKFSPMIYLINFNSSNRRPIVVDQYLPVATPNTWQDMLTNQNADIYAAKYSMSVSISKQGYVLVGMQFINRVFLFSVNNTNPKQLTFISRNTNGRSIGNGRSVAWLGDGTIAAIIVNVYSLLYQWSASNLYFYDMRTYNYNSSSTPLSVFPNYHQPLPTGNSPVFLFAVSSSSSIALMDDAGDLLIFNPTAPGNFPLIPDIGPSPLITSSQACPPGTYKDQYGVYDCIVCPTDTKASNNGSTTCVACASNSLCSLGSVDDVPKSVLKSSQQVIAYPESPESTIYEEILIHNIFSIGSGRCLLISPLFWSLIAAGFGFVVAITIGTLHFFVTHARGDRVKEGLQKTFKRIDMIREGELWVGGLASLSLVVLLGFAYAFSSAYFKEYPIESATDFSLGCDQRIRNAKFETGLMSLGIPGEHSEIEMFDLLEEQQLTLNVDFIDTHINCDVASLQALLGTTWSTIRWSNCQLDNAILSLTIPLPAQHTSVQIILDDTGTIGALRIGLSGDEHHTELHYLKELHAYESFSKDGCLLAHTVPMTLTITKVINQTLPISGEESNYTGIFIITYDADLNSLFVTEDQFVRLNTTQRILTVAITETPYYVKNKQQPIVRTAELVFHNLLFTVVCFEIFGLLFVLYKLIVEPVCYFLFGLCTPRKAKHEKNLKPNGKIEFTDINHSTDEINEQEMIHRF